MFIDHNQMTAMMLVADYGYDDNKDDGDNEGDATDDDDDDDEDDVGARRAHSRGFELATSALDGRAVRLRLPRAQYAQLTCRNRGLPAIPTLVPLLKCHRCTWVGGGTEWWHRG